MNSDLSDKKNIVCIATRRIDDDLPTNVQHLMLRLAGCHRVLYVEPPVDSVFLTRNPNFSSRNHHLKRKYPVSFYPISPLIFSYEKWVPFFLPFLNRYRVITSIKRAIKRYNIKAEILWLFNPKDYWMVKHLNPNYLCYHITDRYKTMPCNVKSKKHALKIEKLESKLIQQADVIFCTAKSLWKKVSKRHSRAVFVGNVADAEHFGKALDKKTKIPNNIKKLSHPIIGFFGAINDFKIDYSLIEITAKAFPKGNVVMIGPVSNSGQFELSDLPQSNNIHYLGTKDYQSLPNYLKGFDMCIIPYRKNAYTNHVFPLKLFEYLSSGKPVVSTDIPSLIDYGNLIYVTKNESEWINGLKMAYAENSNTKISERKALANTNSWPVRVAQIENILSEYLV